MTCFPLMGVGDFVSPPDIDTDIDTPAAEIDIKMPPSSLLPGGRHESKWHVRGPVANSAYIPDAVINPHPRFGALTKNIRVRSKVQRISKLVYFWYNANHDRIGHDRI